MTTPSEQPENQGLEPLNNSFSHNPSDLEGQDSPWMHEASLSEDSEPPLDLEQMIQWEMQAEESSLLAIGQSKPTQQSLSLKAKAAVLAIVLGVLPTIVTTGLVSLFTTNQMRQDLLNEKSSKVQIFADSLSRFMAERYGDIQVLATLPILSDPSGTAGISEATKTNTLERYLKAYGVYNSIVFADPQGNVVLKTSASAPKSFKDVDYFQAVLKTKRPVIQRPRRSIATGKYSMFLAAPVFDVKTQAFLGVVRTRVDAKTVEELYFKNNLSLKDTNYWLIGEDNQVFIANNPKNLGQLTPEISQALPSNGSDREVQTTVKAVKGVQSAIAAVTIKTLQGAGAIGESTDLNWRMIVSQDTQTLFADLDKQIQLVILSIGMTVLVISAIAVYLANRAIQPLLAASQAVQKIGHGDFTVRVSTTGDDELAQLGENINRMAEQIQIAQLADAEAVRLRSQTQQEAARQQAELAQQQLAAQEEVALQQAKFAEEQRRQKEAIQMQLVELLSSIEGAAQGDLTVRADVSADEIGVVADFFNSIIESLRQIVTQVKFSAQQVNQSVGQDEAAIQVLAQAALNQATEVNTTLISMQGMAESIQAVALNAQQAAQVARTASETAAKGGLDMDQVVRNITGIQFTVRDAVTKVRQLGESSQEISKALNQINQIALQTDLLAINAEIEAARSGAAGQRFAVVAREVSALAARSAEATQAIEQIIADIQRATQEVAEAMETSTTEVEVGAELVAKTKSRLEQVLQVSEKIDDLVATISQATESQSQTSQVVTQLMKQVAASSEQTAESSRQVSEGLQMTAGITEKLQASVRSFKVSTDS